MSKETDVVIASSAQPSSPSRYNTKCYSHDSCLERLYKEIRLIDENINLISKRLTEFTIAQNDCGHFFKTHDGRITALERIVYGAITLVVTAVFSALIYTVVKK